MTEQIFDTGAVTASIAEATALRAGGAGSGAVTNDGALSPDFSRPMNASTSDEPPGEAGTAGWNTPSNSIKRSPKTSSRRQTSRATPEGNATGSEILPGHHDSGHQMSSAGEDTRFADPLVLEIREMWRMRRRWMKARNALILQAKAFGRALSDGDKDAGTAIYDAVLAGKSDNPIALLAMSPFISGIERFDSEMTKIEKSLEKLAKKLPVAPWVAAVRGFGFPSLAAIVGECGDLSAYRTVSGVWKRAGLAVIDGEGRQRRVADADRALLHGYSPERRSAIWNVAEPLARQQRTWLNKETSEIKKEPGPYGEILETEKAKALAKEWRPAHAEAHAKRLMTKALLRDLTVEWRRIARGETDRAPQPSKVASPPYAVAAE